MKVLCLVFLGLLALACSVARASDDDLINNGRVLVKFDTSGRMRFWIPSRSAARWTLELESLCEAPQIAKRRSTCIDFGSDTPFAFGGLKTVDFQGISATRIAASTTLNDTSIGQSSVLFETEVLVFDSDGSYTVHDETFTATRNTFKWSFNITGWAAQSVGSSLQLRVRLDLEGVDNNTMSWANNTLSFSQEESTIEFASAADYAGTFKPITIATELHSDHINLAFTFDAAPSIYYDPQATMGTDTGSASAVSSFLFEAVRSLVALWA
jgi:hypothetical protein